MKWTLKNKQVQEFTTSTENFTSQQPAIELTDQTSSLSLALLDTDKKPT